MPLYKGIYYADGSTPMSAEAISAAEATSVGDAIENLPTKVANATERDAKFPTPVQGNSVWRMDIMCQEVYHELYNPTSNTAGAMVAGWYIVAGKMPRMRAVRNAVGGWTNGGSAWLLFNNNTAWDLDTDDKTGTITRDATSKFYVTRPGLYQINAAMATTATGAIFVAKKNNTEVNGNGAVISTTNAAVSGWCRPNLNGTVKLLAGDYISFSHYGTGSFTFLPASTEVISYFELEYLGPA